MKEQKIHYEPHPVTPERKAELRAQGLTIIDIVYAPPDHVAPVPAKALTKAERKAAEAAAEQKRKDDAELVAMEAAEKAEADRIATGGELPVPSFLANQS